MGALMIRIKFLRGSHSIILKEPQGNTSSS